MFEKTIEELLKETRESLVVDLRKEADFRKETYPGAKHIWWEALMDHQSELPKDNYLSDVLYG